MVSFIALYRGKSLAESELVAVSNDPNLIGDVASTLLRNQSSTSGDPALTALTGGKRRALRIIKKESKFAQSKLRESFDGI